VREALDKVRRVLRDLDERAHPGTPPRTYGPAPRHELSDNYREDLLRTHEAAKLLKVAPKDVYAAVRDDRLSATRFGRFLWFRREDVEAFADQLSRGGPRAAPK
jgi:excisionase family DNA binding protein